MIEAIWSGGQTGVDRAALDVALELGYEVGGYCPKGRLAEDGRIPDKYPLVELETASYPARTRANIEVSHATLILTDRLPLTGGTLLTYNIGLEIGNKNGRGIGLYVAPLESTISATETHIQPVRNWIAECKAAGPLLASVPGFRLNVAGPRESKCPGVYERAAAFLRKVLAR